MSDLIKVTQISQLGPGQRKLVKVKGKETALFNLENPFFAINNACPHSTGPLVEGRLLGTIVTCPWHGAQFDVANGQCCSGPATKNVTTYPVHVEGDAVFIEIN